MAKRELCPRTLLRLVWIEGEEGLSGVEWSERE